MYYVGEKAFADCKNLKCVRCKDFVQYIMKSAYEGCDKFAYASRPKRKNIKHISFTKMSLDENSYKSDKALRRSLAVLRDKAEKEEP